MVMVNVEKNENGRRMENQGRGIEKESVEGTETSKDMT